ncbi:hypothetical protein ACOME3_009258 [Neoechinorhynchus agilis]
MNTSFGNTTFQFTQNFGVGGFVSSPIGSKGNKIDGKGVGQSSGRIERTVIPVTSCIIHKSTPSEADSNTFKYGDLLFNQVYLVGIIRSVESLPTSVTYVIDDMTGPLIEVKQYLTDKTTMSRSMEASDGLTDQPLRCLSVIPIKFYQEKFSLIGFSTVGLKSANQLTAHLLEVIYCHQHYKTAKNGASCDSIFGVTSKHDSNSDIGTERSHAYNIGLRGLELKIYEFIKENIDDAGVSINEIISHFSPEFNEVAIR